MRDLREAAKRLADEWEHGLPDGEHCLRMDAACAAIRAALTEPESDLSRSREEMVDDPESPDGDHGWNPDGWPLCPTHKRPMRPTRVEEVRERPGDHPAGCFYGSFGEAYPDAWHVPAGVDCRLDHGAT